MFYNIGPWFWKVVLVILLQFHIKHSLLTRQRALVKPAVNVIKLFTAASYAFL